MSKLPRLTISQIQPGDKVYAACLGNLAAVDDMVGSLVTKLQQTGLLDNTYIISRQTTVSMACNRYLKMG